MREEETHRLDQNLIKQAKVLRPERPAGFYRLIALEVFSVVSASGFSYFYRAYLNDQAGIVSVLVPLGMFLVFSVFGMLLTKSFSRRLSVLILEIIGLMIFFYDRSLNLLLLSALILAACFLWGEAASRREIGNNLELRFFRISKPYLEKVATAIALSVLILYLPQWNVKAVFISEKNFGTIYDWAAGLVSNVNPDVKLTSSVEALARSIARSQLKDNPQFQALGSADQEAAVAAAASQVLKNLSGFLGVPLTGKETVSGVFYNSILRKLSVWREQFGNTFLVVWAAAAFLVLRSLAVVFYWLAALVAFALYQIFLSFGFLQLVGENRTKETIEFT